MQASTVPAQAPAAPLAPAAPAIAGQGGNVVTTQMMTRRDVEALRACGEELSRQIKSASDRRQETRNTLQSAVGADKAGLEQRLGVLDARIARLEQDISENGVQLASLPARQAALSQPPTPGNRNNDIPERATALGVVFTLFVLAPIAFSIARGIWRRGSMRAQPTVAFPENAQRLDRMEQAIDTIAIEMERVSEGQRFITRILSEGRPGALPDAQRAAEPIALKLGDKGATPRY
jgi:hypothetical protein